MSILCSADHFGPTCLIVRFRRQLYLHGSLSHIYIEADSVELKDFRPGTKTSLSPEGQVQGADDAELLGFGGFAAGRAEVDGLAARRRELEEDKEPAG